MSKKLKGFKEFMRVPRQVPRRIPAGTKYINGVPQDNVPAGFVRVPDHISGGTKLVKEGIVGAALGGAAGFIAGGPLGAALGAAAGHKIQQRASRNISMVDATAASKIADVLDKRSAKKAVAAGQTRFRPGAISRYFRNVAVRKSGGMYAASPDATEPVQGLAQSKTKKVTKTTVKKPTPAPQQVQKSAAPETPTAEVHPTHVNHPGHGIFPKPIETTAAGQSAALRRAAVQRAVAARIRAQEKTSTPRSSTIIIP